MPMKRSHCCSSLLALFKYYFSQQTVMYMCITIKFPPSNLVSCLLQKEKYFCANNATLVVDPARAKKTTQICLCFCLFNLICFVCSFFPLKHLWSNNPDCIPI